MSQWQQFLTNTPSNSLLIYTTNNTLIRFYCPIPAICDIPIAGYVKGHAVNIDGIYQNADDQLLYLIGGLKLPHHYFSLNI